MGTVLTDITLVLVAIVVIALVISLVIVIVALRGASRNLYQLADGLRQIAEDTRPLPNKLNTINGALVQLRDGLLAVDGHLARVADLFGQ